MKIKNEVARLGRSLFSITAVVALLLSVVNGVTKDQIAKINEQIVQDAMAAVMPGAEFEETVTDTGDDAILAYAKSSDGGCCVQVQVTGFGGPLVMVVGIDADGMVTGVQVTEHEETPGLGAKAQDEEWIAQFAGTTSGVSVTKSEVGENQVEAISGATITSDAVASGVNLACQFVKGLE